MVVDKGLPCCTTRLAISMVPKITVSDVIYSERVFEATKMVEDYSGGHQLRQDSSHVRPSHNDHDGRKAPALRTLTAQQESMMQRVDALEVGLQAMNAMNAMNAMTMSKSMGTEASMKKRFMVPPNTKVFSKGRAIGGAPSAKNDMSVKSMGADLRQVTTPSDASIAAPFVMTRRLSATKSRNQFLEHRHIEQDGLCVEQGSRLTARSLPQEVHHLQEDWHHDQRCELVGDVFLTCVEALFQAEVCPVARSIEATSRIMATTI